MTEGRLQPDALGRLMAAAAPAPAPLLRAHGRLGDRRRGRGPGGPGQGGRGVPGRRHDRAAGELAVPHRPQCGPRRAAPSQAAGGASATSAWPAAGGRRAAADARVAAAASLAAFLRLPVAQRSSVVLIDVLGHSLVETAEILGVSLAAVKAALHRARARLRELADAPDGPAPSLAAAERDRLRAYADRFNARDFDALRALLAEDVRLDLVNRPASPAARTSRSISTATRRSPLALLARPRRRPPGAPGSHPDDATGAVAMWCCSIGSTDGSRRSAISALRPM